MLRLGGGWGWGWGRQKCHHPPVRQEQQLKEEVAAVNGQLSALQEELESLRQENLQLQSECDGLEMEKQRAVDEGGAVSEKYTADLHNVVCGVARV